MAGYSYPARIQRLCITRLSVQQKHPVDVFVVDVVFTFKRLAAARRKKGAVIALLCSALLCSALLCSEERNSIPHGCQAPFRQKHEKSRVPHLMYRSASADSLPLHVSIKIRLYYSKTWGLISTDFSEESVSL